ncbi:MAG TPA: alpha/beta hydrolase [Actinomycetota bacterium]|nr:alpha/beta hydrolase [Actinomycetota bacterium]
MPYFDHPDGLRLHYVERGGGPPLILLHGLLWSSRMFVRLRRRLDGHRVILLDMRGHGLSERPDDASLYTWAGFGSDVVAVMDHLGLEKAVVGGLSLGANVTLSTALDHPARFAGLVVEMPVLWRARGFAERLFTGLAGVLHAGGPVLRASSPLVRRMPVPRSLPEAAAFRDVLGLDPLSAVAVIRGLLSDELPDEADLSRLTMPALVIGHRRDPLHVLADARHLADRLPDARFVSASSILEYRVHPERLVSHLQPFLDEVWERDRTAKPAS